MKAILIARVSTEEQKEAGNSLPAQEHRIEQYFKHNDHEVIKRFSFDESAYKSKRDDFDQIIEFVQEFQKQHKEKLLIGLDKVDRLSRNVFDKRVSLLYEKALNDEIELHFVNDGQVINSRLSAVEKFNFSISLGLAKYYSDAISDNVKRAQEQKLRKGEWPGKAPYGYENYNLDKENTEVRIEEYQTGVVRKVYELYSTGAYSMNTIRDRLKKDYNIEWSKGFLDKVLKNPFYYGVMIWKKKSYPHKYPPIVTKRLFDDVQAVKSGHNKKRFKYKGKPYFYRGLIKCAECGCQITAEKQKGHVYYHCTQYKGKHGAEWLREEDITAQLSELFEKVRVPDEIIDRIVTDLQALHDNKIEFKDKTESQLLKERATITQMRDRNYRAYLQQRITEDDYDKYDSQFRDELANIDARLGMLQEADDQYFVSAKYILELSKRAKELFESSKIEQRRQIIKLVLSNLTLEGKKLRYEAVKPFDTILNCADGQRWLPR